MNKREFDFSGISARHEKGYTGKNIRIANLEGTDPSLWFFNGKIKDPFGSFKPDNPITRAEFARVLSFIIDKLERK